jgi:hypothetical protein
MPWSRIGLDNFELPDGNSISDEVTGGAGAATFEEVIPKAQKVSGHMREGHRKPREVPGNQTF